MAKSSKTSLLQIRVSPQEKRAIARAARTAGMDMASYVLARTLGSNERRAEDLLARLNKEASSRFVLAELYDLLAPLGAEELRAAVTAPPPDTLSPELANYVAAMVEYACGLREISPPDWTSVIPPLMTPMFGSTLESLRLHLLVNSAPCNGA